MLKSNKTPVSWPHQRVQRASLLNEIRRKCGWNKDSCLCSSWFWGCCEEWSSPCALTQSVIDCVASATEVYFLQVLKLKVQDQGDSGAGRGAVESCLPGFQMVPASCVSVRGEKSPGLLKVSWSFRVKIQFFGPRLTSLHLYRPVLKHSHSGDKGFRMWMPGETTECIAWGLALWSQPARVASKIICSPCVSVSCTLKVKILCVAFYVE